MRLLSLVVVACVAWAPMDARAFSFGPTPPPATAVYCATHLQDPRCLHANGSGDHIDLGGADGNGGSTQQAGDEPLPDSQPVALSPTYVRRKYVLACTGNSLAEPADFLCGAAISICDQFGPGYLAWWRFQATFNRSDDTIVEPGWQNVKTVCLSPDSPLLDPIGAITAVMERDFQSLVVLKGVAVSQPGTNTLVNYRTGFYTTARRYVLPAVDILGHTVVVTATPKQYDWYFGDHAIALDAGPGAKDTTDVSHVYRGTGRVAPYVVITWSGTYTIDGGAPRPVVGTATTTGPGTPLTVKQARAELVAG